METATEKLDEFAAYETGWFFGMGAPFTTEAISVARQMNEVALALGYETDAFPGSDSAIQLVIYSGTYPAGNEPHSELEISGNNRGTVFDVCADVNNRTVAEWEGLSVEAVMEVIRQWKP